MIRIGRRDRGLCHLGDLIDALFSIFKGQRLICHRNAVGGDQVGGMGGDGLVLG